MQCVEDNEKFMQHSGGESSRKGDQCEDLSIDRRIILKLVLN
jgi:hypothetical protein